jgi:hypothetical protein
VWRVTFQLAAAIAYCHEGILRKPAGGFYTDVDPGPWRTIWHRDIKPENGKHRVHGQCDLFLTSMQSSYVNIQMARSQ